MKPLFRCWCLVGLVILVWSGMVGIGEASWLDPAPAVKKMYGDLLGRAPKDTELEKAVALVYDRKGHLLDVLRSLYRSQEFATRCRDKKFDFVQAAYLGNLGRPADGEGHQHYLDLLASGTLTKEGFVNELANSEEGRTFALRQLYFEILYRDLDEAGRSIYLEKIKGGNLKGVLPQAVEVPVPGDEPEKPARPAAAVTPLNPVAAAAAQARTASLTAAIASEDVALETAAKGRKTQVWVPVFNEAGKQLPEIAKELLGSFERDRVTAKYQQARDIITRGYQEILGRQPDAKGLRHYLSHWVDGRKHLVGIWEELIDCEESKKRKRDEIEIAYLRHLLRSADGGGLDNYRNQHRRGRSMADIRQEIKCSNEGICAAVRRAYWEILNREIDQAGRSNERRLQAKNKPEAYKTICIDLLDSQEAKSLRFFTSQWREVREGQEQLAKDDAANIVSFLSQFDAKLGEEVKKAEAQFKDLERKLPAEFASLTFNLEEAFAGVDLQKMQAAVAKLLAEVQSLGPLLTGEVQKIFVELTGQPAPDFYAAYNLGRPAWEGDKLVGTPTGPVPGVPGGDKPSIGQPALPVPGPTGPVAVLPDRPTPAALPALPGFEVSKIPADLLQKAQQAMAGIEPGPKAAEQLKTALTKLITGHPFFQQLEPQRQERLVGVFQEILRRPPTPDEIKAFLAKLQTGTLTLADLRAELEKTPEFALVSEVLKSGRIIPFKDDEKKKADEENQGANGAIKDNQVKLSDLDGFKTYEFASEVVIAQAVKTEDADGFCITGMAQLPSHGVTVPVKVFAKQHPSLYGYRAHILGFFLAQPWKASSAYKSLPTALKDFVPTLALDKGALLFTTVDAALQIDALPETCRGDFAALVDGTGNKSVRLSQGLNILGHLNLSVGEASKHLGKLLGGGVKSVLVQGHLAKEPEKIYVRANLPAFGKNIFPPALQPGGSSVEFTGKPSVAVQTSLGFTLPENQPVSARVRFEIPVAPSGTLQMVGALDGVWKDAFKISGLTIGNLVLSGKITVPSMAPAFGLAGDFRFGDKVVRIAASIPLTPNLASLGLRGSINLLGLEDLIALAREMGMDIGTLPFPADLMGLKDVDLSIAGQADPTLGIPQGVTCRAKLCLRSDVVAAVDAQVNKDVGVVIKGVARKIELGPIAISGDGPDRKPGTPDDGAVVDILLPPKLKSTGHAYFSGRASIFNVGRDLMIWIDRRGLGFADAFKIFDAFTSKVEVQGETNPRSPNFRVKCEIQADLAGRLARRVDEITGGNTPNFVRSIFKNIFNLRRAGFEGDLARCIKGAVPEFWFEFGVMGAVFDITLALDLSNPENAVQALAGKAAGRVTARVREFVVQYLKAIADFFKNLFSKRKSSVDDIIKRFRNAPNDGRNGRSAWDGEGNRFGSYYDRR